MAWPMFHIDDPVQSIKVFCSVLEQMSPTALEQWYVLSDRFLHIAGGDVDMDASDLESTGFVIPSEVIRRIRQLRLRVQIVLHLHAKVKVSGGF